MGTRARSALDSYVGTPEGQDALLRIALGLHPEGIEALEEPGTDGCMVGVHPIQSSWYLCKWGGGQMRSVLEKLDERARAPATPWIFRRLAEFLPDRPTPSRLSEYPGYSFAAWRSDSGYRCSVDRIRD